MNIYLLTSCELVLVVADVSHTTFNLDQSELRDFSRPLIGQWKQLATVDDSSRILYYLCLIFIFILEHYRS